MQRHFQNNVHDEVVRSVQFVALVPGFTNLPQQEQSACITERGFHIWLVRYRLGQAMRFVLDPLTSGHYGFHTWVHMKLSILLLMVSRMVGPIRSLGVPVCC